MDILSSYLKAGVTDGSLCIDATCFTYTYTELPIELPPLLRLQFAEVLTAQAISENEQQKSVYDHGPSDNVLSGILYRRDIYPTYSIQLNN